MNWAQLCKLGHALPEVDEGIWYRTPCLEVRGKRFVRLKEDGVTVVFILESVDEQDALIEGNPEVYFITDHYRGWPAVLARLAKLRVGEARVRLERGWRLKAPRALLTAFDEDRTDSPPAKRGKKTTATDARRSAARKRPR